MRRALGAVLVVVACAGCAASDFSASSMQRELIDVGLTEKQAVCVTDGLQDRFDPRRLSLHDEPTSDELAKARTVLRRCGVRLRAR